MDEKSFKESLAFVKTGLDALKKATGDAPSRTIDPEKDNLDALRVELMERLYNMFDYVNGKVNDHVDRFHAWADTHSKGHLPAIKTPSQMEHVLKTLGMDEDFEVLKPAISIAKTRHGLVATAEYRHG